MTDRQQRNNRLSQALEAIGNLMSHGLNEIFSGEQTTALAAHAEIGVRPVSQKSDAFYRHFVPLRNGVLAVLTESYRRYFKLALAHPREAGPDSDKWASTQLQPAVSAALGWIRDWYVLACEGENQYVRLAVSTEFVPKQIISLSIPMTVPPSELPQSWRAPVWLFQVSSLVGISLMKEKHLPPRDSEEKLGAAHTRLLLKGARRMFLGALGNAIQTIWNEETAAAGAIPVQAASGEKRRPNKRKGWEQRLKLYGVIRKVLSANPRLQGIEFCAELDKRHAPPLLDWMESGEWPEGLTWKEAWGIPQLRRKIRRVRQEAQKAS